MPLKEGDTVRIKPTEIQFNRSFNDKQGAKWQFFITTEDGVFEYDSPIQNQDHFFKGVPSWVKVGGLGPRYRMIFASEPPNEKPAPRTQQAPPPAQQNQPVRYNTMSASGQTITFAMGYAKDIVVAKIAAGKVMSDEEIVIQIEYFSDAINDQIIDKLQGK